MHCLARCSYDGSSFCGFAKTPPFSTVQDCIEQTLKRVFSNKKYTHRRIDGGSRTDKGVHALDQCITFYTPDGIDHNRIKQILNYHLPGSIRIKEVSIVDDLYNINEHIVSKSYFYIMYHAEEISPFLSRYVWHNKKFFSEENWNAMLINFIGKKDFRSFAKEPKRYNSTICHIESARAFYMEKVPATVLYFRSDRFLYNMIRRIVGFCHYFLQQEISPPLSFEDVIQNYQRWTSMRAPSNGLYLYRTYLT